MLNRLLNLCVTAVLAAGLLWTLQGTPIEGQSGRLFRTPGNKLLIPIGNYIQTAALSNLNVFMGLGHPHQQTEDKGQIRLPSTWLPATIKGVYLSVNVADATTSGEDASITLRKNKDAGTDYLLWSTVELDDTTVARNYTDPNVNMLLNKGDTFSFFVDHPTYSEAPGSESIYGWVDLEVHQ